MVDIGLTGVQSVTTVFINERYSELHTKGLYRS